MFTKSIHFRMTMWYTLVLSSIIIIFSLYIYGYFSRTLDQNINNVLESKAEAVEQVIAGYNEEDKSENTTNSVINTPNADFINAAKYAVEENTEDNIFVQLFRPDKAEIVHSGNLDFPLPLLKSQTNRKNIKAGFYTTNLVKLTDGKSLPLKIFTVPVSEENKYPYYIQVSASLEKSMAELAGLKTALFLFFPFSVFIIAALGQFLTKIALSPVVKMTNSIHQITSKNLKEKIDLPDANDEIKQLAETFNGMLERIDIAFSSQQQLIQDISHELRTPLTALKGNQEVTLSKKRNPEEYERILRVNLEEIDRMSQLIENLLFLARLENKPTSIDVPKSELKLLIEKIIKNMKILADRKNISLLLKANDETYLDVDNDRTGRVFSNIIDNAIKYTPANGLITVTLEKAASFVKVFVSDTGSGIAENELQHIFDRFYRVDKSRSDSGFGLGLSIAKSIIDAQKGKIEVESVLGRGTTFIVSLPLKQS
jgi:heavy metal sensor kinase